jgi:hypothetical protein
VNEMTSKDGSATTAGESGTAKRRRRGGKRLRFKRWPQAPAPVKALWESASEEEKARAHEECAAILAWWLGRADRQEVAARLQVGPIRAWQLSQQALAGMAAGLLRQPRTRKALKPNLPPEEDPRALRKQIAALEKDLEVMKGLVELLRGLPANRGRIQEEKGSQEAAKTKRPGRSAGANGAVAASTPSRTAAR